MIDLRQLRYFVAVAETGHLTRAAERLGIQQPPLSQQIRALEDQLGTKLFRRLPRGMALTAAGRALLDEARAVLARLDRALEAARRAGRGEQGRIAVGFTSSAAFHPFVAAAIRAFRQAAPAVDLGLEESSTTELVDAVRAERLDAAFVRAPPDTAADVTIAPLLDEPMLLAAPAHHPLAHAADGVDLAALAAETLILYRRPTGPGLYDAIIAACRAAGFSPSIGQEAPRMLSTLSLVAAGLGLTIIPASMRRLNLEGVVYRPLTGCPGLTAPLRLAWRTAEPPGPAQRFVTLARQLAQRPARS